MTEHEDKGTLVQKSGFGGGQLILASLGGAVVGAVVGLLFSPWSGAEARKKASELAKRTKGRVTHFSRAISDAGVAAKEAFIKEERKVTAKSRNGHVVRHHV